MTKSKNTKRALWASILSMLVCVAMLVGSTFAWFTDSVSTSVNRIQAGTLKIDLVDAEGNSLEGTTLGWEAHDKRGQDAILWEPGATYNTQEFYIKNAGNLNLKFKFVVSGINGDAKLLEVIDFTAMAQANQFHFNTGAVSLTPSEGEKFDLLKGCTLETYFYGEKFFDEYVLKPGETAGPITITGHMQETAGNEYQGLSIEGIAITLIATQATGDEDSFNGTYDKEAEYPVMVTDSEGLRDAMAAQNANIVFADDVQITGGALTVSAGQTVEIDLGGKAIEVPNGSQDNICTFINNGGNLILKNGVIRNGDITDDNYNAASPNRNAAIESYGGKLTVENCVISNSAGLSGSYAIKIANDPEGNGCVASFKNCTINGRRGGLNACGNARVSFDGGSIEAGYYYPFFIDGNAVTEFNNTEFIKADLTGGGNFIVYSSADTDETGEATFNSCTFKSEKNRH